ncbi:MAG: hypothetical protein PF444_05915 [Bacteroidales bacterium]|jgi:hypothetical protein|nr:hypothetical protein [Bacteroidales bacterium]
MMKKHIKYISVLVVLILASACEEEFLSDVPDIHFSERYDLDNYDISTFGYATSTIAIDYGGYAGVIIYCVTENNYKAFDLCCPIHYEDKEQLSVNDGVAFCPTDSIDFILQIDDPYAIDKDGNAAFLKSYNTSLSGNVLTVYN